jgi:HAMP domain-containing protein/tetratricopeptide (TPR) repeat protein
MTFFSTFFINYSTIGSFLTTLIALGAATFLFLLPKKSKATVYLALVFTVIFIAGSGYVFSNGSYDSSKWPRLLTLLAVPFRFVFLSQFLLRFPNNNKPKLTRVHLYLTVAASVAVDGFLLSQAIPNESFFDINGHAYDLAIPAYFAFLGKFLVILILISVLVAIWKAIISKGAERKAMFVILFALFIDMIIPLYLNIQQRNGAVTREAYTTGISFLTPIGAFLLLIPFLNTTKDRSTFMFKIVGVSFLTFVLIFNVVIFMTMMDREETYDYTHRRELRILLETAGKEKNEGLEYILEYKPSTGEYKFNFNKNNYELLNLQDRMVNSYIYDSIRNLPEDSSKETIESKLNSIIFEDAKYSAAHQEMIKEFLETYSGSNPRGDLLTHIDSMEKVCFFLQNKIKEIPDTKFMEGMEVLLTSSAKKYEPYRKTMAVHLKKSMAERKEMKTEILRYLTPIVPEERRYYRENITRDNRFVSFQEISNDVIHETGFSYIDYRTYLHKTGLKLMGILLLASLLIFVGTPFFLSGAILNPLNDLLSGLRQVKKGHLDVQVPVKVQDEIGFLASSFNSMVASIRDSKAKLEEYSTQLEVKVEERTKELQATLSKVEELKTQQDGDYFLTTLLLKPLGVNNSKNDGKIKIDFFLKQKKQFQFKKKNMEIGGDMCIAQPIMLRGKKYTTYLNADAMGKSMQGAGGVLVLGAVFQSIIQRTNNIIGQNEVSPEVWIKSAFKELHKIFESFEGSMLISLIFGLIEESSGLVYYINAEHPFLILYRDNVASFIESDSHFRKLGTTGIKNEIFVNTFQMLPGDMIIMGSDGKDDLVLEWNNDGGDRIINEDETLFLKRVEESKGDLEEIYEAIVDKYDLMDDLSLLSISFKGETEKDKTNREYIHQILHSANEALEKNQNEKVIEILENAYIEHKDDIHLVNYMLKTYIRFKHFDKGSKVSRDYLLSNEGDITLLMKAAYCNKMNKDIETAIDIGERIKLRDPKNVRNLLHLADMYIYSKNYIRAKKLVSKVLSLEPGNDQAKLIDSKIKSDITI